MTATATPSSSSSGAATSVAGQLPKVQARRTLLIGLGTTGACICGQILDRLNWAYDKVENIPWVRCVVLETKDRAAAPQAVRDHARFVHLEIDRTQYFNLINNPQDYEDQIAFSSWNILELTRTGDAITDGAKNIRILGRLSLLFPPNYNRALNEIRAALAGLEALDEKEASQSYSQAAQQQTQIELDNKLHVYVVGTLCGGTSSGSFIDMGYILQNLDGYGPKIMSTGMFLLPSGAYSNAEHTANSYAALMELNHYSSSHGRYQQQMPDRRNDPRLMPPGTRPYKYLYLLQARGDAPTDYPKLVTSAADHIYSDVIGGTAADRDATRTNIETQMMHTDMWGATQKFYTFGMGTIEFPYAKVMKACSLKLAKQGLQQLAGGTALTGAGQQSKLADMTLLNLNSLIARLLQRTGLRIDAAIAKVLEDAYSPAMHSNDPIELARAQVEAAFQGTRQSDTHSELPINIVPLTIEENVRKATVEMHTDIEKAVRSFFKPGAPDGLIALASFLEILSKHLETLEKESKEAEKADSLPALQAQADDAQEHARLCRTDLPLRLAWGRSAAVKRYVRECLQHCQGLYAMRLRQVCAPACGPLYAESRAYVDTLRNRLSNPVCGLMKEVHILIDDMEALFKTTNVAYGMRTDGTSRVINGVELFDAATTVDEEYDRCLRETAMARSLPGDVKQAGVVLAGEAMQAYVESCLPSLLATTHQVMRFDNINGRRTPEFDDGQIMELARAARGGFSPLNRRSIIERLLERPDMQTDLKKANDASSLMLNWENLPRHRDADNKSWKFLFYNDHDAQARQFRAKLDAANVLDAQSTQNRVSFINDHHQIMILRERGAFSLGTITELKENSGSKWENDYLHSTSPSFHSRKDVPEWITWARTNEDQRVRSRNVFLIGVALKAIQPVDAQQYVFKYPRKNAWDSGTALLSNDLDLAAQVIKKLGLQADIQQNIDEYRASINVPTLVGLLDEFIRNSSGKFMECERKLSAEEVGRYILDYIEKDNQLLTAWQTQFPNTKELRLLARDANGNVERDDAGSPIYKCPCARHEILGYKSSCLYVRQRGVNNTEVNAFQCSICDKPLDSF